MTVNKPWCVLYSIEKMQMKLVKMRKKGKTKCTLLAPHITLFGSDLI